MVFNCPGDEYNMSSIIELYASCEYDEILDTYLEKVEKLTSKKYLSRDDFGMLQYTLLSCGILGYYKNFINVLNVLKQFVNIYDIPREFQKTIADYELEALVYYLFNPDDENVVDNVINDLTRVRSWQDTLAKGEDYVINDRQLELRSLVDDFLVGKMPIYEVGFLYPFEPLIKDYKFNLDGCYPFISMEVKATPRDNDLFTEFKFTCQGLVNPDAFWRGPSWQDRERFYVVTKVLPVANAMLLQVVKASPGKMVLPYSVEQVSTVSIFQYKSDGMAAILGGTITCTDFGAHWVGTNAKWCPKEEIDVEKLQEVLVRQYTSESFVTLYHHSRNMYQGGFYLEAFVLLEAACDGFMDYWCKELALKYNINDEYKRFVESTTSDCEVCEVAIECLKKNKKGMVPSCSKKVKFLYDRRCMGKSDKDAITSKYYQTRRGNLRNDITHGQSYVVTKKDYEIADKSLMEIQELFVEISQRVIPKA